MAFISDNAVIGKVKYLPPLYRFCRRADEASDGRLRNLKANLLDVLAKRKFNGIVRAPATRRPIKHPSKVNSFSDFGMKLEPVAAWG